MTIEIDHIGLSVANYAGARKFYAAAMAPLRMIVIMEFPMDNGEKVMGLGADGKPFLWISGGGKTAPRAHIAIRAESRAQVDAFYAAAMAAGGKDNGAPGLRPHYHENYYGAFVLDPEGRNIEAVFHGAPVKAKPARKSAAKASAKRGRASVAKKPAKRAAKRKPAGKRKTGKKKR